MGGQQIQRKRVFIFDPCFGEMSGHWENYCKRLYDELLARDYEVKVFGQKKFLHAIVGDVNFQPVFQYSPYTIVNNLGDFQHQVKLYLGDFNSIDSKLFQDGDLFIFHSIFPQILAALVQWSGEIARHKKIMSTVFFQFPPSESKKHASLLKKIYYGVKSLSGAASKNMVKSDWLDNTTVHYYQESVPEVSRMINEGSLVLFASTDVLSRNFSLVMNNKVHYLPMPGEKITDVVKIVNPTEVADGYPVIKIGYFGHSSLEKGGQFLPYIVKKTLQIYPQAQFVLHINPNTETAAHLRYFDQQLPNVTCFHGHIDQKKMMDLIQAVDVILMPYSAEKYATTPSAVFTEGMPLQKLFVLPEKTWVSREARKYYCGYTTFKRYTHKAVLGALLKIILNYEKLKVKSKLAAQRFYQENNIENYIDVFEKILADKRESNDYSK